MKDVSKHPIIDDPYTKKHTLVGSRFIGTATEGSDHDILVLTLDLVYVIDIYGEGTDEYESADPNANEPVFVSIRYGDVNFIVTESEEFYYTFLGAARAAKWFHERTILVDMAVKPTRVSLHQAVIYGKFEQAGRNS